MSKQLLSKKSVFMTRRKIIIYIVMTILILGIVAGFTNTFYSDNRRLSAEYGETIVMEAEPPKDGTPADYDLLSNLKFTAYKLHHSTYFRGFTKGKVIADVGGVGSYTQNLTNTRVVYNMTTVFAETISSSSLKSVAEQKYAEDDIIIYRPSTKISGNNVTYSNKAYQMSYEDYSAKYGSIPNQLSKYIINEKTILSVKDENAKSAAPLNASADQSDDDDGVTFYVPDKLYPNADGNFVFSLTLDPQKSSYYYRNEVRTLGGADSNPLFHSVRLVITVNSEWIPLSVRTYENYDLEIPVLGAMNCSGDNLEEFTMINADGEVPEKDFFGPYIEQAKNNPNYKPPVVDVSGPPSAADYLSTAFADYLSGEKNLDLKADIAIGDDFSAYDLTLSVNLNTLDIQAMLGDGLYVKYGDGKVYLKNNDINGYISVENAKKLMSDPAIAELLGGMGGLDLTKIFGGDMLDVIFANCEMTTENDLTTIPMSFALDLTDIAPSLTDVRVDASIVINDNDKSLTAITGDLTVNGIKIHIDVEPLKKAPSFPSVEKAVSLDGIIDFAPDILATAKQTTYGIDGTLTLNGMDVGVSAYIDRENGLTAQTTLNVMGLDVVVKYVDETIYAEALGITVRGTVDELPDLLTALFDLLGMNKYQSLLKAMLPSSVNEVADMLKTLTVNDDTLKVGLEFLTIPIDVSLTRVNGKLKNIGLDVNVNLFGIKADVGADINISEPTKRTVTAPTANEYITFADLARIVTEVKPYLQANYYTVSMDGYAEIHGKKQTLDGSFNIDKVTDRRGEVTGVSASGKLTLLGQNINVVCVDDTAYLALGGIKVKLNTANTDELIGSVKDLVTLITGKDEILPDIDIADLLDGAIKNISIDDGLTLTLSVSGCDVTVTVDLQSGKIGIAIAADNITAQLNISVAIAKSKRNITAPKDAESYVEVTELAPAVNKLANIVAAGGAKTNVVLTVGETRIIAGLQIGYDNGTLKARLSAQDLALDMTVIGDTAYITLGGVKVCGTLADITRLIDEVKVNLPAQAVNYISDLTANLVAMLPTDVDVAQVLDNALASVKSLSLNDGVLTLNIGVNGVTATINATTDLKEITATVSYDGNAYGLSMTDITATAVDPTVIASEYVPANDIVSALDCVLPLINENAFDISVNGYVYGQTVIGNIYVDLADYTLDNMAAKLNLTISDVAVDITVINKTLYLDINNGSVRIAQELNAWALKELIAQLDQALPELGIADMIGSITNGDITLPEKIELTDIVKYLDVITLSPTADGMALNVTVGDTIVTAEISLTYNTLSAISVDCDIAGKTATVSLAVDTENGVLIGVHTITANILGTDFELAATVTPAQSKRLTPPSVSDYVTATEFIPYIAPAINLMDRALGSDVITLDVGRMTLDVMQKQMDIRGRISIALSPAIAVRADLVLFANTADEIELTVIYADGVLYIKTGETVNDDGVEEGGIKLKLDINNDIDELFAALEAYLPDSIKSLADIASMSAISAVINGIKQLQSATSIEEAVNILFGTDNAFGASVVKQALDTAGLIKSNGNIALHLNAMSIPVNFIPELDGDELGVVINTQIGGMIGLDLKLTLGEPIDAQYIVSPADGETYVSIITFVTKIIDAANTLTAKPDDIVTTENGVKTTVSQMAFEVDSFTFDYDIYKVKTEIDEATGETVQVTDPETGRVVIEENNGVKVVDKTIKVTTPDSAKALRFAIVTTKTDDGATVNTSTTVIVEAHLVIDIIAGDGTNQTGFPISLDLYVTPTEEHPEGLAYLYYREANGYGEKISLDYTSIMQIVAAVMDIVGADDETVEQLLGDYRLPVDTEVFDSMAIAGFDDIRKMLNGLAGAITEATAALSDITNAWNRFQATTDIDELIAEISNDTVNGKLTVKSYINSAVSHINAAVKLFASDDSEEQAPIEQPEPESNKINGALVGKILRGISFTDSDNILTALVDNEMATGTKGTAAVTVASRDNKINNIGVKNLDVNTAKLKTFDLTFAPTQSVEVNIPDDYTDGGSDKDYKLRYADFGNIKHLLFDVMNTANMLEFDIGGGNGDKINLSVLGILNVDIGYNVKVKIIDQGEGANPRYKTAADITLDIPGYHTNAGKLSIFALAKCQTRIIFYDNVIYMHGVESWKGNAPWVGNNYTYDVTYKDYKFTISELMDIAKEVDANGNKVGIEKLFKKVVFRLLPLAESALGIDIHKQIIDAIKNPPEASASLSTIAQIFKQYTYLTDESGNGVHQLVIGLKELALNGSLRDVDVKLTGANDGDNNVYDNYVSHIWLKTSFGTASMDLATITLDATLTNTAVSTYTYYYLDEELTEPSQDNEPTEYAITRDELESMGLTQTVINGVGYSIDGSPCFDNATPKSLIGEYIPNTYWNAMDW